MNIRRKFITYHAKPQDHAAPKEDVVQQSAASNPLAPLQHYNRHLEHHRDETVASELSRNAAHDKLMRQRRDEEGDCRSQRTRHVVLRRRVDVSSEEMVTKSQRI